MTQPRQKTVKASKPEGSATLDELLTRIASPVPTRRTIKVRRPAPPPVGNFTSRFFIKDVVDVVADMKAANKTKRLEPDNQELSKFERTVKKTLPKHTQPNIKRIREFFINELAPLTIAVGAAVYQAKAVLKNTTGDDPDPAPFASFERMARAAVNLRMAQFLQDYLELPESAVQTLLDSQQPVRSPSPVRPQAPDYSTFTDAVSSLERAMTKTAKGIRNGPVKG